MAEDLNASVLDETPIWPESVPRIESRQRLKGGMDGNLNAPLRVLAQRTAWLRQQLGAGGNVSLAVITQSTKLTAADNGKVLLCVSANPVRITLATDLPDSWQVTLINAGAPHVRVDCDALCADGYNTVFKPGAGVTVMKLDAITAAAVGHAFWLAGAATQRREDVTLPDGSPLELPNDDTLEITF